MLQQALVPLPLSSGSILSHFIKEVSPLESGGLLSEELADEFEQIEEKSLFLWWLLTLFVPNNITQSHLLLMRVMRDT